MNTKIKHQIPLTAFRFAILCGISLHCSQPAFAGWYEMISTAENLNYHELGQKCKLKAKQAKSPSSAKEAKWKTVGKTKEQVNKKWIDRADLVSKLRMQMTGQSLTLAQQKDILLKGEKAKVKQEEMTEEKMEQELRNLGNAISEAEKKRLLSQFRKDKEKFQQPIETETPSSSAASATVSTPEPVELTDAYYSKFFEDAGILNPTDQANYRKQASQIQQDRPKNPVGWVDVKQEQEEMTEEKMEQKLRALGDGIPELDKNRLLSQFRTNKEKFQQPIETDTPSSSAASAPAHVNIDNELADLTAGLNLLEEGPANQRDRHQLQARITKLKAARGDGKETYQSEDELMAYMPVAAEIPIDRPFISPHQFEAGSSTDAPSSSAASANPIDEEIRDVKPMINVTIPGHSQQREYEKKLEKLENAKNNGSLNEDKPVRLMAPLGQQIPNPFVQNDSELPSSTVTITPASSLASSNIQGVGVRTNAQQGPVAVLAAVLEKPTQRRNPQLMNLMKKVLQSEKQREENSPIRAGIVPILPIVCLPPSSSSVVISSTPSAPSSSSVASSTTSTPPAVVSTSTSPATSATTANDTGSQ